jgi:hypothetical protein
MHATADINPNGMSSWHPLLGRIDGSYSSRDVEAEGEMRWELMPGLPAPNQIVLLSSTIYTLLIRGRNEFLT